MEPVVVTPPPKHLQILYKSKKKDESQAENQLPTN
jgi:hypothetical protein